jgi:prepilin-type N-terminal cleavage/methylation domain-containing protein
MLHLLRGEKGLTIVELMVVVALVAVIAAIAVSVFQDVQKKTKLAADSGTVASLRSAVAIYYGKNNGTFPSSGNLETLVTPMPAWNCTVTYTYDAGNGKITHNANLNDCP